MCSTRSDAALIDQCLTSARAIQKRTDQSALYIARGSFTTHRLGARDARGLRLNEDINT